MFIGSSYNLSNKSFEPAVVVNKTPVSQTDTHKCLGVQIDEKLEDRHIDRFTVVCLVAWPLNESEAGVDLVLIETLLLFICKFLLISMRTASLT